MKRELEGNPPAWHCFAVSDTFAPARILLLILAAFFPSVSAAAGFADGLDTPGWSWTVTSPLNGTNAPTVLESPGAKGGMVIKGAAGGGCTLSFDATLEAGMLIYRCGPQVQCYATFKDGGMSSEVTGGPRYDKAWKTYTSAVAAGTGRLSVTIPPNGVLDFIEFVPEPKTPSALFGLSEQSVTPGATGGRIAYSSTFGDYVWSLYAERPGDRAWIDFPVTGPAELKIGFQDYSYSPGLSFQLDGKKLWKPYNDSFNQAPGVATITVGEGTHTVSVMVETTVANTPGRAGVFEASIRAEMDGKSGPLDRNGASLTVGNWEPADINHDGVDALRPAKDFSWQPYSGSMNILRMPFEGPGFASAWFYRPQGSYQEIFGWTYEFGMPAGRKNNAPGWRKETIWLPPGATSAGVSIWSSVSAAELATLAVDEVSFTPDTLIPLSEALAAPGIQWDNNSARPWTGILRGGTEKIAISAVGSNVASTLSGNVMGPGILTFRSKRSGGGSGYTSASLTVGSKVVELPNTIEGTGTFSYTIEQYGPAALQWSATSSADSMLWLEISDVVWTPVPGVALSEALDTGSDVSWTASDGPAFVGRAHATSFDGSAAQVTLNPGQEAWLEAVVDGPGIFDFKQVEGSGTTIPWISGAELQVWIDGIRTDYTYLYGYPDYYIREPIWITGDGPHRIRLLFRSSRNAPLKGGVDQVTWRKLTPTEAAGWTGSSPAALNSFTSGGRDDAPVVALVASPGTEQWIERTFTGPGQLEWDFDYGRGMSAARLTIQLDGSCVLPQHVSIWSKHRLAVPAGTHRIRWTSNCPPDSASGRRYDNLCWISGMSFTPGVPGLISALDLPSASWMIVGDSSPAFLTDSAAWDGVDALSIDGNSSLYFCNTGTGVARLSGRGRADSTQPWTVREGVVAPGQCLAWGNRWGYTNHIDSVEVQTLPAVPLAQSIETDRELTSENWFGIGVPSSAADGVDCAFSLLDQSSTNTMSLNVSGGARVRFKWRKQGGGDLAFRVNGHKLRVAAATGDWTQVEIDIGEGTNKLQWSHSYVAGDTSQGMAWIDGLSVTPLPGWTLGGAAAGGTALNFYNSSSAYASSMWTALSYRESGGAVTAGVRSMYGESSLKTMVEGPAVLTFSGRCFIPGTAYPGSSASTAVRTPKVDVGGGGGSEVYLQTELTVTMDGVAVANIPRRNDLNWSQLSISIPEGFHEIGWKLNQRYGWTTGPQISFKPATSEEGWVNGVSIKGGRAYYDEWVAGKPFPSGLKDPHADADGDGASNVMEYACGTDPLLAASKPAKAGGSMPAGAGIYHFSVPYLSEKVVGTIETSPDLKTWTAYPTPVARTAPATGLSAGVPSYTAVSGICYYTATHQVLPIAVNAGNQKLYFRLRLRLPGEPLPQ